jgi:hypothetical protein
MRAVVAGAVATLTLRLPESLPAVLLINTAPVRTHAALADDPVLVLAKEYVARFEQTFSSVMWHEHYAQEDHVQQKFASSGAQFTRLAAKREIESDMLLVWIAREENWIAIRDVMTVDGVPPGNEGRLGATLARPDASLDDLRALAAENGRYNVGRILRTFNEPTLTLLFLNERNRDRFSFKRGSDEPVGDRDAVVYEFAERGPHTIVRDEMHDVPARGRMWIDPQTGQILQTFLELKDRHSHVTGQMTVRYGPHAGFDVLVPLDMRETYKADAGEQVMTVATYSNFRKFQTAARILRK